MIRYIGVTFIIIAIVIAIIVLKYLRYDIFKQDIAVKGQECRKKYGSFSIEQSMQAENFVKGKDWLMQKNGGTAPQLYKRKIKYKNHFEDYKCLGARKGL